MTEGGERATVPELHGALYVIFCALARLCLRNGLSFDAVSVIAKRAFVDVANREFVITGRKQSASRVALLTGVHRKEVGRMLNESPVAGARSSVAYGERVITGWRSDPEFRNSRGGPASLPFEGAVRSFAALVKRYGGSDLPARAVLDELVRVGAAARLRDDRIKLLARAYLPARDSAEGLAILGSDVSNLISAIDYNLRVGPEAGMFQRRVAYDNVPVEAVDEIHAKVRREGQSMLERLARVMARRDRDINPRSQGSGRKRTMVGVYFFADDVGNQEEGKP